MSKEIDERIVSMKFDNDDFEAKVNQTQKSIKELNSSINSADASALNDGLLRIGNTLDSISDKMSATGVAIATVVSNITSQLMEYGSKLTSFVSNGIIQGGYARAAKLEKAQFTMEGLIDDSEEIERIMDNVNYGVQDTAYGLDAAASVASQLVATGMRSGEEMKRALRGISGVAAMTSSEYEDIGRIFTTVAGQGKLMSMQLSQLAIRGINAAATLGEYLGVTEAEVREMVSSGKIDFQTFADAMDDAFGEHAKAANKTMTGALSNIKAALAKIGQKFIQPIIKNEGPLVKMFDAIRLSINKFKDTISPIAEVFADVVTRIINPIANVFTEINNYFEPLEEVSNQVETVTDDLKQFQEIINEIWNGDWDNGETRWNALIEKGYDSEWIQHLVNATEYVKDHDLALIDLTEDQLREIYFTEEEIKKFNELRDAGALTTSEINELKVEHESLSDIMTESFNNIAEIVKMIADTIQDAFSLIYKGGLASKIYESAIAFREFTKSLISWNTEIDEITGNETKVVKYSDTLIGAVNSFKVILVSIFSVIKVIKAVGSAVFKIIATVIKKAIKGVTSSLSKLDLPGISEKIAAVANKVADWVESSQLLESILGLIGDAINLIASIGFIELLTKAFKLASTVASTVIKWISNIVSSIREWYKQSETVQNIINFLKESFNKFSDVLDGISSKISKWFLGLSNGSLSIKDTVANVFSWILNKAADILSSIINILSKLPSKIKEWVKSVSDGSKSVKDIFLELVSWITDELNISEAGKNFIQGFINGISNVTKELWNVVVEVASNIIAKFRDKLGIHSPSAVAESDGENFGLGFIKGIKNVTGDVRAVIANLGTDIVDSFRSVDWRGITLLITTLGTSIAGTILVTKQVSFITKTIKKYSDSLFNFIDGMGYVLKKQAGVTTKKKSTFAESMKSIAMVILSMAAAVLIIAFAMNKIANIDKSAFTRAAIMVGVIFSFMIGVVVATGIFSTKAKNLEVSLKAISKIGKIIMQIATAMVIFGFAVHIIASATNNTAEILRVLIIIGSFGLIVGALIDIAGKATDTKKMITLSIYIGVVAGAFLALGMCVRSIASTVNKYGGDIALASVLAIMLSFTFIVGGLMAFANRVTNEKKLASLSLYIGIVAVAFLALGRCFKTIASSVNKYGEAATGWAISVIFGFGLMIAGLMTVANLVTNEKELTSLYLYIGSVAVAFLALGLCFKTIVSTINDYGAASVGALGIIVVFTGIIVGLIFLTKVAGNGTIDRASIILLAASACFMTMGICFGILASTISKHPESAAAALAVIIGFGGVISGLIAVTKLASDKDIKSASLLLLSVSALFLALTISLLILQFLDPSKMAPALVAITVLGEICAGIIIASKMAGNATKSLIAVTIMIATLTMSLIALTFIDSAKLKTAVIAISATMGALAVLMLATGVLGKMKFSSVGGIAMSLGVAVLAIASIAAVLLAMDKFGVNVDNAISMAKAISILMLAIVPVMLACGVVGKLGPTAFLGVGVFAALIIAIGAIMVGIGALMTKVNGLQGFTESAIPVMGAIGEGLGTLLGKFTAAFSASAIDIISIMITSLADNLDYFATTINTNFIPIMSSIDSSILEGIGSLAAALLILTGAELINGLASLFGADLFEQLPTQFAALANGVMSFWEVIKGQDIDISLVKRAADACLVMAQAAGSIPNSGGLLGKILGENDIDDFGVMMSGYAEQLIKFMDCIKGASYTKEEYEEAADIASSVGNTIAAFADNVPNSGGLLGKILGENDIDDFGVMMEGYASSVVAFTDKIVESGYTETKFKRVANIATYVGEVLSNLVDSIPETGGFFQKVFTGEKNLDTFSSQMENVAEGVVTFVQNLGDVTISKNQINAVDKTIEAINSVAETFDGIDSIYNFNTFVQKDIASLATSIATFLQDISGIKYGSEESAGINAVEIICERIAGIADKFNGTDVTSFVSILNGAASLGIFGEQVKTFLENVKDIRYDSNVTPGINATEIICERIAGISGKLSNIGSDFGEKIKALAESKISSFGTEIKDFLKNIEGLNYTRTDKYTLEDIVTICGHITGISDSINTINFDDIDSFVNSSIDSLGTKIKTFLSNAEGIKYDSNVTPVINSVEIICERIADLAGDVSGIDIDAIGSNLDKIPGTVESFVEKISKIDIAPCTNLADGMLALSESITKAGELNAGVIISQYAQGIIDGSENLNEAAAQAAADLPESFDSEVRFAGYDFANGFATGINQGKYRAINAAITMTKDALTAVTTTQDSASPSKVTMSYGKFFDMGFSNGISKYSYIASDAAAGMTQEAIDQFSNSTFKIASIVENNVDPNPTISPVLDLTNVTSGAKRLNSLLDMSASIGVSARSVQSVSSNMQHIQNGNADIISAINGLGNNLNNRNGDIYNVGGITYDDGSNVANAVSALVTAIRMERRM